MFFSERAVSKFNHSLRKMMIFEILDEKCTNKAYNLFHQKYLELFEASFPVRKKKQILNKKQSQPWYTEEIRDLNDIKQKYHLLHIKNTNNVYYKSMYNRSRNLYFQKIKQSKKDYYQRHLINVKNDVKGTWKVINFVLGRKKVKQLFKLSVNGIEVKNKNKIATEFNTYFSKVVSNLVKRIPACK